MSKLISKPDSTPSIQTVARSSRPPLRLLAGKEGALFLLALALLWFAVSQLSFKGGYLFPAPQAVAAELWKHRLDLLASTWSSFLVLVPAFLLAVATGIAWGLLVGTTPFLHRMFSPFSRFAAPVPPTIYVPYAIALLPTFGMAAGFIVFIGAFWPIFLNSAAGAAALPQRYRDSARILGLRRWEYLARIVLPAALPHIFSGINVGLVLAFIMLTVAELFGANSGLGRFISLYADYAEYAAMVAGILYTGAVVLLVTEGVERVRRRALFWVK